MDNVVSATSVQAISSYLTTYHDEPLEQHYQYYLFNRQHSLISAIEQSKNIYYPLNRANFLLGRFCKETVNSLDENCSNEYPEITGKLKEAVSEWQSLYLAGGTFDTFKYAEQIISGLISMNYPIKEKITNSAKLLKSFICIPYATKAFLQIKTVLREDHLISFLSDITAVFSSNRALSYYMKETTIYRSNIKLGPSEDNFKVIKFTFIPGIVNTRTNPILNEFVDIIKSILIRYVSSELEGDIYYQQVGNYVAISQGNANYKKFLNLLGIIDKVYDEEDHYAYLN